MTHAAIQRSEVHRIAGLARLDLTVAEEAQTVQDFEKILKHVDELQQLDTTQVAPTQHAIVGELVLRPDAVGPSLGVEEALRNAPERLGDGFGVPKIIE